MTKEKSDDLHQHGKARGWNLPGFIITMRGVLFVESYDPHTFPYSGPERPTILITYDSAYDPLLLEKQITEWSRNNVPAMFHNYPVLKFKLKD